MILALAVLAGCGGSRGAEDAWLESAGLDANETKEELYEKALKEEVLVIYTVSTRVTKVKEAFEEEYPGLYVEIRDLRSPDLIEAVTENYKNGNTDCDIVLCNDNSGEFKEKLVDTGIVLPYLPDDIARHMKEGIKEGMVPFIYETMMCFYDSAKYGTCPEDNLWALTDPRYKGRIYMPNPLRSFSTYVLCAASLERNEDFEKAYEEYVRENKERAEESGAGEMQGETQAGDAQGETQAEGAQEDSQAGDAQENAQPEEKLDIPEGSDAAHVFWERIAKNTVFTNSSDEVVEALGNGNADFGFMVSSKMRLKEVGYNFEPIWKMKPFAGCPTSFSVMIAKNAGSVNAAKLFIRFLLGETDGTGAGYKPFSLPGTWSARTDVPDATDVAMADIDLVSPDTDDLIRLRPEMEEFWTKILKQNLNVGE
ncbi:MAG: extracellular solute-binding protein [Lachnospiraceae bacterium]|nr:extracellular solute-binding protein [Lachnospiraceae bacterium]